MGYVCHLPTSSVNINTDSPRIETVETGFMNDYRKRNNAIKGVNFRIAHSRMPTAIYSNLGLNEQTKNVGQGNCE